MPTRAGTGMLPPWAEDLLPRLGVVRARWRERMAAPGLVSGNVLGFFVTRRQRAGAARMASDK